MLVDKHLKLFPPEEVAKSSVLEMIDQLSVYEPGFKALLVGYAIGDMRSHGVGAGKLVSADTASEAREVWIGVACQLTKGR